MIKVTEDHYCNWIVEGVIIPAVEDVVHQIENVDNITMEIWDAGLECTMDYGNEYVLIVHLDIQVKDDEPLDEDLGVSIGEALEKAALHYLGEISDGDFYIGIQKYWLMNSSIVLPITMQK